LYCRRSPPPYCEQPMSLKAHIAVYIVRFVEVGLYSFVEVAVA